MSLLSWVAIIFLLYCLLNGLTQGFIKMLYSTASFLLACVISMSLSPSINSYVSQSFVYEMVNSAVYNVILMDQDYKDYEATSENEDDQNKFIDSLPLPDFAKENLKANNDYTFYNALGVQRLISYVSLSISRLIINDICFLIVFVVSFIVLKKMGKKLDLASKLTVSANMNKIGGVAFGIINGIFIMWLFINLATALGGTKLGDIIYNLINDSTLLRWIYNKNFLMSLLTNLQKIVEL